MINKSIFLKFFLLVVFLFSWFFFQYSHHEALLIKIIPVNGGDKINLFWDSGQGYTGYETKEISIIKPETLSQTLPQTQIYRIMLESASNLPLKQMIKEIEISSHEGIRKISELPNENKIEITEVPNNKVFSKFLIIFQISLAILISLLIIIVSNYVRSKGGISKFFSGKDEKYLLLTFSVLFIVYLFWVLTYWPVAMTNDSWSSYGDIKSLKFSDWHPYFYSFFILALLNFYDSLGSLSIFQSFSTSLILAYGFYFCAKQGIRWRYLMPLILYSAFSIPIGAYNTMMWKDVPYSICILLLSVLIFKYANYRSKLQKKIVLGIGEQSILFFAALGAIFFRHNGIIYLPFVLFIFYFFLERKIFRNVLISLVISFFLFKFILPKILDIKKPAGAPYQQMKLSLAIMTHPAFYSPTRDEDIKTIEDATKHSWKTLKENFPQKWFWLWDNSEAAKNQWNANGGQTEKYNSAFLVKLIYYNIHIFLAEQTFGFLHSIGMAYDKSDKYNDFYEDPMQTFGTNLPIPGRYFWGTVIPRNPPLKVLTPTAENIISWSCNFQGIFSRGFAVWGLPLVFIIMFLILFFEAPCSAISLYVITHLLSAGFVFLIGAGESWRYFYNIYLAFILIIPFWYVSRRGSIGKI